MNFSVLLSVYNKETPNNLDECLRSISLDQTLQPTEIILVKDGQLTTELNETISYWCDILHEKLVLINIPENVGLGNALNIGLESCSYEWIFRMDTDDICLPDRFEKQINFIKNNPEVSLFSGTIKEFDTVSSNFTNYKELPTTHENIIRYATWKNPFNHVAVAFKKSAIQKVGGYQHHLYMEDYNLWLRVLSAGFKSANLKDTLVLVRAGEDMIKRRKGKVYINSEWQLFKLKRSLGYQSTLSALFVFFVRSAPRLLPTFILTKVYSVLRSN